MAPRWRKWEAALLVLTAVSLATTCSLTSVRWVNTTFPGIFVMANRVVASVSLPHWPVAHGQPDSVYQHAVVAVNAQPVHSSEDVYAIVRRLPPGVSIPYTLEKDGKTSVVTLSSLVFSLSDYVLIFVAYVINGLMLTLIGIVVWVLKPATPASLALLIGGVTSGFFTLTAADLYGPHWFFRLHVLGEAFFPAAFIHLSLVFPVDRFRRFRSLLIATPYLIALMLGIAYEIWLYNAPAYSLIHNLCMVYVGVGAVIFVSRVAWDYYAAQSYLVRQRIRVILLGFLGGFALPSVLMFASGVTGGAVAVNYAAFTAFLFPLSLGYAIVKHDLFEIDTLLKRGVYYLTLSVTLTASYLVFLSALDLALRSAALARSPFIHLLFTLLAVLFLNPLKEALQRGIDRVFFRLRYNPKIVLERASAFLASTLHLEEILAFIWRTISETLGVQRGGIFLTSSSGEDYRQVYPLHAQEEVRFTAAHPLIEAVRQNRLHSFSLNDLASSPRETVLFSPASPSFQLITPLILKGELIGFIALGQKESGRFFSADDQTFLLTLANQSALSISNARAYQAIQDFNAALERKVDERTQQLGRANEELQLSLRQLEQAYREVQHSQENLLRAEKMAALGRLTAGIAHEMNTPLGASLTSLKLLQELVEEYQSSLGDPSVNLGDHQDIAAEMNRLVHATQQWVEKAAVHIRSLRTHTRDLQNGESRPFSLMQVIDDTGMLLSHRLRLSQCSLIVSCTAANPILSGDPGKLGQVFTNLIVNAIDAYHGQKDGKGEIFVEVSESNGMLEIRVRDHGSGIPQEHIERIFEEFFSTKPLGEGTGLGLSIARDIVMNFFGGSLSVSSQPGRGSEFCLRIPRKHLEAAQHKTEAKQTRHTLDKQAETNENHWLGRS